MMNQEAGISRTQCTYTQIDKIADNLDDDNKPVSIYIGRYTGKVKKQLHQLAAWFHMLTW